MVTRRGFISGGCAAACIGNDALGKPVRSALGGRYRDGDSWSNPYVTDGLIAMWDGEWNAGGGVHQSAAQDWPDLIGGVKFSSGSTLSFGDKWLATTAGDVLTCPSFLEGYYPSTATFEFFIQVDSNDGAGSLGWNLLSNVNGSSGRLSTYVAKPGKDYVAVQSYLTNSQSVVRDVGGMTLESPTYIAFTTDGASRVAYVAKGGGSISSSTASFAQTARNAEGFLIGGGSGGNWSGMFFGRICCIRFSDRALTAAEIAANYAVDKERFDLS